MSLVISEPSSLGPPGPETTIAILLGASEYPRWPQWSNPVLGLSANAFRDYLHAGSGLALTPGQILNLFDADGDPSAQLLQIADFLKAAARTARDLILYYVGHGSFYEDQYHLGIRYTRKSQEFITSLESRKLAHVIKDGLGRMRVYVILDSCYSASAVSDWQGPEINAIVRRMSQPLPRCGTAFLAAASKDDVTRAPRSESHTLFTGALLKVLTDGIITAQPKLSMYDLYEEMRIILYHRETDDEGRPELHVPNQREGDVSRLPIFPNTAYRRAEADRARAEAIACAEDAEQVGDAGKATTDGSNSPRRNHHRGFAIIALVFLSAALLAWMLSIGFSFA